MRLAWKVNLPSTLLMCAALLLLTFTGVSREEGLFDHEMRQDHAVLGAALAGALDDAWTRGGPEAAQALAGRLDAEHLGVRVRLVSAGASNLPAPAVEPVVGGDRVADGWRYTWVPLGDEAPGAAIELRESVAPAMAYLAATRLRMGVLLLTLLAATAALDAWVLDRTVFRPIRRMVAHARRVAAGNLTSRAGLTAVDEIGDLGAELDRMAEALQGTANRLTEEAALRHRVTDQLRHAERLASIGRLAAGIAHELGTPLNVVMAHGHRLERWEVAGEAEARSSGRTVAQQAARMAGIVRQLLDFARPGQLVRARTDLVDLTGQAASLLSTKARHAGVALEVHGAGAACVDARQIEQAVLNLVSNAIDATPAGGEVRVAVAEDPDGASIEVADTGSGIAAEHVAHLFEPFFTTKEVGRGTGLGLSVSYGIVREHGGRIEVDTDPGHGSTFRIVLPTSPT
ncbi:MAG: HAMP domain-containing histidine kinase [Alphaproteobacteria bacterium]|nr:HAMP domain-containing histidine kinase [Alphaproteobacteria bacterium]MCB9697315.1 HAMP domain-containing histidine kinase [Alphaproteobacteria bacterium]